MISGLALVAPLVEQGPDPSDVKAGWVALAIFLLLGLAVVFLGFSLVKHLKRAKAHFDVPEPESDEAPKRDQETDPPAAF
jgi:hypothetical protein